MNSPAPYIHWGFILISLPNLILILFMIALFAAGIFMPFPGRSRRRRAYREPPDER